MKKILVTGAGGSIGSELSKQLYNTSNILILLDKNLDRVSDLNCLKEIVNICDHNNIREIIEKYQPDTILHAAANKYVPELEKDPKDALLTNVIGTFNLVNCALDNNVKNFVLVSTDKAVNPISLMGHSKRAAELCVLNAGYSCVRLVNVLGSAGSVVEIFNRQIENNKPLTITDSEMTRYFMLVEDACQLILAASELTQGGEIFILDGGPAIKITDLALNMIAESGKNLPIIYSGIRPGERLHEIPMLPDKNAMLTSHSSGKIWKIPAITIETDSLKRKLAAQNVITSLLNLNLDNPPEIIEKLKKYQ